MLHFPFPIKWSKFNKIDLCCQLASCSVFLQSWSLASEKNLFGRHSSIARPPEEAKYILGTLRSCKLLLWYWGHPNSFHLIVHCSKHHPNWRPLKQRQTHPVSLNSPHGHCSRIQRWRPSPRFLFFINRIWKWKGYQKISKLKFQIKKIPFKILSDLSPFWPSGRLALILHHASLWKENK